MDDEYVVTCQIGSEFDSELGTPVFASADVYPAWRCYYALEPLAGTSIALWDPYGGLMASRTDHRE